MHHCQNKIRVREGGDEPERLFQENLRGTKIKIQRGEGIG